MNRIEASAIAQEIARAYANYRREFDLVTERRARRFEIQDWRGAHEDADERLESYGRAVSSTVTTLRLLGEGRIPDTQLWAEVRSHYSRAIARRNDEELAESFFNSVCRRVLGTIGQEARVEFTSSRHPTATDAETAAVCYRVEAAGGTEALVRALLERYRFSAPYQDADRDIELAAARIDERLAALGHGGIAHVDTLRARLYRDEGAFIVGRITTERGRSVPIALAMMHCERGVVLDAVLLDADSISILFSFTRSYFHARIDDYRLAIAFLHTILPRKRVAELYTALGHHKHGKTELYRDFAAHLDASVDRFDFAPGKRGLVMLVFALPSYDQVFKVIRDTFGAPKKTTREHVLRAYELVFRHDRVGRLVDTHEWEYLSLDADRFEPALLEELQTSAARSVRVRKGRVLLRHLYTERRLTPLDIYVREAPEDLARAAVIDLGAAIKALAAANIFPGDMLLKNFGVTRHGRVVFYDYDEIGFLVDYRFRRIPPARSHDDELSGEVWYTVADNDVFPEEIRRFMGLPPDLFRAFEDAHGDLFDVGFWQETQDRLRQGEPLTVLPYGDEDRIRRGFRWDGRKG
jgi:isocitrate dehydrogenase kinase/phosphatase